MLSTSDLVLTTISEPLSSNEQDLLMRVQAKG